MDGHNYVLFYRSIAGVLVRELRGKKVGKTRVLPSHAVEVNGIGAISAEMFHILQAVNVNFGCHAVVVTNATNEKFSITKCDTSSFRCFGSKNSSSIAFIVLINSYLVGT